MSNAHITSLSVGVGGSGAIILDDVSLVVSAGEIVGLAGETGSGKSTVGLSLLGYLSPGLVARHGRVEVEGTSTIDATTPVSPRAVAALRGATVSYVPQDPGPSLNPRFRLERTFIEHLRAHQPHVTADDARERQQELFDAVGLPTAPNFLQRYPHELSGGQQQRVAIALAFAHNPAIVVMDEPTTGLDASTKTRIVELIQSLAHAHNAGVVLISHDLGLLIRATHRLVILYHGRIVENIASDRVISEGTHPYTRRLVHSLTPGEPPRPRATQAPPPTVAVNDLRVSYGGTEIIHSVSLAIEPGETLAVVGESGSGKTTLARAIAGLHPADSGSIHFTDVILHRDVTRRTPEQRQKMQYVFQNPWSALNPRRTVGASVALAAKKLLGVSRSDARARTIAAFESVGLREDHADSFPQRLSGGQRQRAALARALVAEPTLLICDEVTSSLDLTVQAEIVDLLSELQRRRELSLLFITHDLSLTAAIAHRTLVLYEGNAVETGPTETVLRSPSHPYTIDLVAHNNASR